MSTLFQDYVKRVPAFLVDMMNTYAMSVAPIPLSRKIELNYRGISGTRGQNELEYEETELTGMEGPTQPLIPISKIRISITDTGRSNPSRPGLRRGSTPQLVYETL